jgi:hypothetical protein
MFMDARDDTWSFNLGRIGNLGDTVGWIAYKKSKDVIYTARGDVNELQVDKSGRWLFVSTNAQGEGAIQTRIVDLENNLATENLTDNGPDFAPSHADVGTGIVVGNDNWTNRPTARSLSTPHKFTELLQPSTDWESGGHYSMLADNEEWCLFSFYGKEGRSTLPQPTIHTIKLLIQTTR